MTRLRWFKKDYELGLDRGVFYPKGAPGVVWDGLISAQEADDGEQQRRYVDGVKTYQKHTTGDSAGIIEAFTYPDEFYTHSLTETRIESFGVSYRVQKADSYEIHLIYNAKIPRGEISHNQSEIDPFRWAFTTLPVSVPDAKPSAHLIIKVDTAYSWTVEALEEVLYGSDAENPRLPEPAEVFQIFEDNSILQIIDHGDGTWTAKGPDDVVKLLDPTTFEIDWPSAVFIDATSYTIHSL